MNQWPYALVSYSPSEVQHYCVQDTAWQKVRLSMKGISTPDKLDVLWDYMSAYVKSPSRAIDVQVSNYINALKRGGQLDMDLKVQR